MVIRVDSGEHVGDEAFEVGCGVCWRLLVFGERRRFALVVVLLYIHISFT